MYLLRRPIFITFTFLIIRACQTSSPLSSLWWKTKLTLFGALLASWTGWPPTLSLTRLVFNWFSISVYIFFAGRHEEATGGVVSHLEVCRPCLLQLPWCKGSCDSLFLFFDTKHHDLCDFLFPGIWQLVLLLPLAAHLVQEGVQLPRHLQLVGGSLDKDVSSPLLVRFTIGRLHYLPSNIKEILIHSHSITQAL